MQKYRLHINRGLILCLVLVSVYPKFAVDGMLGKIAKKLRVFGFDTLYFADTDDNAIIDICLDEKRVFLTKDRELYKRSLKANIPCFLVDLENELESLVAVMKGCDIGCVFHVPNKNTRCTLCNGDPRNRFRFFNFGKCRSQKSI